MRYYLSAAHYRSTIEYHEGSLREAEAAVERIEGFLRAGAARGAARCRAGRPRRPRAAGEFAAAMDDDLDVSGALAVVHETVRAGNTALDDGDDEAARDARRARRRHDRRARGQPARRASGAATSATAGDDALGALDALVSAQLEARAAGPLRTDFATADAIRDQLTAAGIAVEDTAAGARWSLADARAAT